MRSERLDVLRLTAHPSINDTAEAHLFNPLGALRGDVMVDAERRDADKKPGKELEQRPGKTGKSHFQTCRFVTSSIISLASPSLHPPPPPSPRLLPHRAPTPLPPPPPPPMSYMSHFLLCTCFL